MCRALRSLRMSKPISSRLRGLGVLTRLAQAVGIPGRDALVAASVVASVVLSSAGTPPGAAQARMDGGAHPVVAMAMVMEADSPEPEPSEAADSGDGGSARSST